MPETPFVFDTVVLSNFALSDSFDLLMQRYRHRLLVTEEVLDELASGVAAGYSSLQQIENRVRSGQCRRTFLELEERVVFSELLQHLGAGEASCIAVASNRSGVVVTDDRVARLSCTDRKVRFTGTIGVLKAACVDGQIAVDDADAALEAMVRHGFYSPVSSIRDIL